MDEGIAVYSSKTAGKGAGFGGFFPIFSPQSLTGSYTQPIPRARWYHSDLSERIWDIKCPSQAWPGRPQINDH